MLEELRSTAMEPLFLGVLLFMVVASGLTDRGEQQRIAESVGVEVQITEAPFTVALTRTVYGVLVAFCTGSIIDREWVLTAAHCVENDAIDIADVTIVAGADSWENFAHDFDWINVQTRKIKKSYVHPKYSPPWYVHMNFARYDVALLHVDAFQFNERVNEGKLWAEEWTKPEPNAGHKYGVKKCQAYGWGTIAVEKGVGVPTKKLLTVTVSAGHGTKACHKFLMFQQRRLICTVDPAICPGDSGGPLVCDNKIAGVAHISFATEMTGSLDCNSKPTPASGWMYVCPLLQFIHHHVTSVPEQPLSCLSPPLASMSTVLLSGLGLVTAFVSPE